MEGCQELGKWREELLEWKENKGDVGETWKEINLEPQGVSWTAGSLFRVIVIIVEFAVLAAPTVILLQIICVRRAGGAESSVVLHQSSLIFSSIAGQQKFPLKLNQG
ncbi:hypothetical protein QQF64_026167 [Cirrhinus molitorella]|uniref:Uncharacterized protein n=1 Tax=Cirrhinus molitorella TaxID=172907 RepID=A0ABR3NR41_9TELE